MLSRRVSVAALTLAAMYALADVRAADPTDNPIAAFYSGPEGYPAWTDAIGWDRVINMKTYAKGNTAYEKFEKARDQLEAGGVLYYPAGTYDFTTIPPGRGLMLRPGIVVRGDAPAGHPVAADGKLELGTKFAFSFRDRAGGKVPADWNFVGVQTNKNKGVKTVSQVGLAWVHVVGATVAFGPQMKWGKTWATAAAPLSGKIKKGWGARVPDGTHPIDALAGGGEYQGAGQGRFVFGCVLEDAAVLDDYSDPGYGPDGFNSSPQCARVAVYGSRLFVANNLLPKSKKGFRYKQKVLGRPAAFLQFDYGKTCGIDVNRVLLAGARDNGACPGYFEEGVVVRDNFVFNHGHTGYAVAGNWVTVAGNRNERAFQKLGDDASAAVTLDGWDAVGPAADNMARAFDLAGSNLWADRNRSNNTGASTGVGGESIVGRGTDGTQVHSWALTHNVHARGAGAAGGMGGWEADCIGLLVGWNQTAGWVGSSFKDRTAKLADCAWVGNKCEKTLPDARTVTRLGLPVPLKAPTGKLVPPANVVATVYRGDAVQVDWAGGVAAAVGFRVERKVGDGKWQAIAYRPPRPQADANNPASWVDFTAPSRKPLAYRVVALDADDGEGAAGEPTPAVTLSGKEFATP